MGSKLQQTDLSEWLNHGVDPEIRAVAINLVSALGGSSLEDEGPKYIPGDDAVGVLRDLRRWVRQELQADRLEVARCLTELNVTGDLVGLISFVSPRSSSAKAVSGGPSGAIAANSPSAVRNNKLLLLAIDLLAALTWPVEIDETRLRKSHFAHLPVIRKAQQDCKFYVLAEKVLTSVVMVCGKVLQDRETSRQKLDFSIDVTEQGEGTLKLGLYLVRNLLLGGVDGPEVDGETRSAVIMALAEEGVFDLLLALGSNIENEFGTADVVILEILFYLVRGVNPDGLMASEPLKQSGALKDLLERERETRARDGRSSRSRHSRFGGLVWVKEGDRVKTVSANRPNLASEVTTREWEDKLKKPKPKRGRIESEDETNGSMDFITPISLSSDASAVVRRFVADFLDSSFNPVFGRLQRAISSQADRVLEHAHGLMFFYLSSWLLAAQKVRRDQAAEKAKIQRAQFRVRQDGAANADGDEDDDGFSVVAAVLNRPMFSHLHSQMEMSVNSRSFMGLQAQMRCFSALLQTTKDMGEDEKREENVDIAENLLNWMFYDSTVHDRLLQVIRLAPKRSLVFLDTLTDLVSLFTRMIDGWGGSVVAKTKKKRTGTAEADVVIDDDSGAESESVAVERRFDAKQFAVRMSGDVTIRVFVAFLRSHEELNAAQLKRCHRFFYRVAFKLGLAVHLWRVPVIRLIWDVGRRGRSGGSGPGSTGLSLQAVLAEWNTLAMHLFRMLTKQIEKQPETLVEMLFAKTSWSWTTLEHGHDYHQRTTIDTIRSRRGGEKELKLTGPFEFKPTTEDELSVQKRIGVAAMLLGKSKDTLTRWLDGVLEKASSGGDDVPTELVAETDEQRAALAFNGHFHLLLTELTFGAPGTSVATPAAQAQDGGSGDVAVPTEVAQEPDTTVSSRWKLPGTPLGALSMLAAACANPPFSDAKTARRYIRKVPTPGQGRKSRRGGRGGNDDDSDSDSDDSEQEADLGVRFPAGGPTSTGGPARGPAKPGRRKRKRTRAEDDEDDVDAQQRAKERKKKASKRELEKLRKIKSALFVHDSDDDDDDERDRAFFASEADLRNQVAASIGRADPPSLQSVMARQALLGSDSESEQDEGAPVDEQSASRQAKRPRIVDQLRKSGGVGMEKENEEAQLVDSDSDESDDGLGLGAAAAIARQLRATKSGGDAMKDVDDDDDDDDDDDAPVVVSVGRRRAGPFAVSSDDE